MPILIHFCLVCAITAMKQMCPTIFDVFTAVFLRIQIYWDVTLCCWVSGSQRFWEHTAGIFKRHLVLDCLAFEDEELWEPFSITSQTSWDITDEGNVINDLMVISKFLLC